MSPMSGPTGSYDACFTGVPAPNVAVGVNGCYYAYKNLTFSFSTDVGTRDVKLVLITGQADECARPGSPKRLRKRSQRPGTTPPLRRFPGRTITPRCSTTSTTANG